MFEVDSVLLDAEATEAECEATASVLASRGTTVPVGAGWTLPPETGDSITFWVTVVTLAAGWPISRFVSSFLGGYGQRLGEHLADRTAGVAPSSDPQLGVEDLIALIHALHEARDAAQLGPEGVLEIQDAEGARIHLLDGLPPEAYEALARLELSGRGPGVWRWYEDEGWVWIGVET